MNPLLAVILAIASQAAAATQATVELRAVVSPDTVQVGERFELRVSLHGVEAGARVVFPELPDSGEVIALGPPTQVGDRPDGAREMRYELTAWSVGELSLPAGEVRVESSSGTTRLALPITTIFVSSVLPEHAAVDSLVYRPAADVLGPSWSVLERTLGAGFLLAILLGFILYARRRGATQPVPIPTAPPARDRALAALERLDRSGLIEAGEFKAFYSELSEVVREFLAESFGPWSRDLTTGELLATLGEDGGVDRTAVQTLSGLLESADLVKFARLRPSAAEAARTLGVARAWIDGFEHQVEEPTAAEEGPDASLAESPQVEPVLAELEGLFSAEVDEASGSGAKGGLEP